MSCIAGVGANVRSLVRTATSGRPVVAIDGCPLACCERALAAKGVRPAHLVRLHKLGLKKRQRTDFSPEESRAVFDRILADLAPALVEDDASLAPAIADALGPA